MAAIIELDEYRQRVFPQLADMVSGDGGATIIHEVDNGTADDDGGAWTWEMSNTGAGVRLTVTDEGGVCIAVEREVFDAETASIRLASSAFYLEGNQLDAFAIAFAKARSIANGIVQS